MDPFGEPPDAASFDEVWSALRGALIGELRRRGLWRLPPSYLGICGARRWREPAAEPRFGTDALDELVAECYAFVFVHRIASLRAQLRLKTNCDGLVFLNVRHFVLERQRRHDPLGSRVYAVLRGAVEAAVAAGELHRSPGDSPLTNHTVLTVGPAAGSPAPPAALAEIVAGWADDLLPELVTTRGKGHRRLEARLRTRLTGLADAGFGGFTFGEVLDPLRREVRRRWSAIFELARGETGVEDGGDRLAEVVELAFPDAGFEARESFARLVDCVSQRLAAGVDPAQRDELRALWQALVGWAAERGVAADGTPLPAGDKPPSQRALARLLGIPRHRLPSLYEMLGKLIEHCRTAAGYAGARAAVETATPAGARMSDRQELRQELRRRTGEAVARAVREEEASGARPPPPQPGDVYLLRATAEHGVEWVVLGDDPAAADRVLAAPADTNPQASGGDLALPEEGPSGALTLRLKHAVGLPRALFEPELRTRSIGPEHLAQARRLVAEPPVDGDAGDPLDRDWQQVIAAAVTAARNARPNAARPNAARPNAARPNAARPNAAPFP
ncbi:MAG: hypothetical protein D6696_15675, partial [Acidobacteria bacterium]